MEDDEDAAARARPDGERLGDLQDRDRARPVVVGAVVDFAIVARLQVVVVRAEDDVFVFQLRVGAFEDADDVLRRGRFLGAGLQREVGLRRDGHRLHFLARRL